MSAFDAISPHSNTTWGNLRITLSRVLFFLPFLGAGMVGWLLTQGPIGIRVVGSIAVPGVVILLWVAIKYRLKIQALQHELAQKDVALVAAQQDIAALWCRIEIHESQQVH